MEKYIQIFNFSTRRQKILVLKKNLFRSFLKYLAELLGICMRQIILNAYCASSDHIIIVSLRLSVSVVVKWSK
jgi:hypothetical protein